MPARSIDTATIAFGLVSIPVKIYSTSEPSHEIHFHLIHAGCGERVKQQYVCPEHGDVARSDLAKGYEVSKGKYVELSNEELKALDAVASEEIAMTEFVPAAAVDPIYVDRSYYLAPNKGGERAFRLLRDALADSELVGIGAYAARGKQYIVELRPFEDGMILHQLRYPDEIKAWSEVPDAKLPKPAAGELDLAMRVIAGLRHDTFDPAPYKDEVKARLRKLIQEKVKSGEMTMPEAPTKREVGDLMEQLKASLGQGAGVVASPAWQRTSRSDGRSPRAAARRSARSSKSSRTSGGRGARRGSRPARRSRAT